MRDSSPDEKDHDQERERCNDPVVHRVDRPSSRLDGGDVRCRRSRQGR